MAVIPNEHIIWGYAERSDGQGMVLFIGLTDTGIEFLKEPPKRTLTIGDQQKVNFNNVTNVIVFHERSKADLKEQFRKAGLLTQDGFQ